MRKKWTYVAVACMLLGTAPVFTGCIDTDEPAGLEDLRGAKSELLLAQAALERARIAEVNANAMLIEAQAALENAKARNKNAIAAINEAKAEQERLKIELQQIQNDEERARYEEQLREYERIQAEWEAEMAKASQDAANAQAEWELAYQKQQAEYEQVLINLAAARATLVGEQQEVLDAYIEDYKDALKLYEEAADLVEKNLRAYNAAVAAVEEDPDLIKRDLDWAIKEAQYALDGANEAWNRANDELTAAQALTDSEFGQKQEELKNEIASMNQTILELQVKAAEDARTIYENDGAQAMAMDQSLEDYYAIETTSEAQEIELPGNVFPWYTYNAGPIEIPEVTFNNLDVYSYAYYNGAVSNNYATALNNLQYVLDMFKSWERDENNDEWTRETISRLEYEAQQIAADIQVKKDELRQALEAYNMGEYPTVDPSAFFGYDELSEAVTSFNAQITKYNNAAIAIQESEEAILTAQNETYQAATKAAYDALEQALEDAEAAYEASIAAIPARLEAAQEQQSELAVAYAAILQALALDPDNEELIAQRDANLQEQNSVTQLITDLANGTEAQRIYQAWQTAQTTANTNYRNAILAAAADRDETVAAERAKITQNETAQNEALTQLTTVEIPATEDAFDVYVESATEADLPYAGEVLSFAKSGIADAITLRANADGVMVMSALSLADMTELNRDALRGLIIARANYLYGNGGESNENGYGDLNTQVLDMTVAELKTKVQQEAAEMELTGWAYFDRYDYYGRLGQQAKNEELAAMAEQWFTNGDALQDLIEPVQAAYDELEAMQETVSTEVESRQEAIDDKWNEVYELLNSTYDPVYVELAKLQPVQDVLDAVNQALSRVISNSSNGVYNTSDIEYYIARCEEVVKKQEKAVYDAETELMRANQKRNDWNSAAKDYVTLCEEDVIYARNQLDLASNDLDIAKNALISILERLAIEDNITTDGSEEEVTE